MNFLKQERRQRRLERRQQGRVVAQYQLMSRRNEHGEEELVFVEDVSRRKGDGTQPHEIMIGKPDSSWDNQLNQSSSWDGQEVVIEDGNLDEAEHTFLRDFVEHDIENVQVKEDDKCEPNDVVERNYEVAEELPQDLDACTDSAGFVEEKITYKHVNDVDAELYPDAGNIKVVAMTEKGKQFLVEQLFGAGADEGDRTEDDDDIRFAQDFFNREIKVNDPDIIGKAEKDLLDKMLVEHSDASDLQFSGDFNEELSEDAAERQFKSRCQRPKKEINREEILKVNVITQDDIREYLTAYQEEQYESSGKIDTLLLENQKTQLGIETLEQKQQRRNTTHTLLNKHKIPESCVIRVGKTGVPLGVFGQKGASSNKDRDIGQYQKAVMPHDRSRQESKEQRRQRKELTKEVRKQRREQKRELREQFKTEGRKYKAAVLREQQNVQGRQEV